MSGNNIFQVNAAYVAHWKQTNPKLFDLKTDGRYLYYQNEKLDISEIYMQDILSNPNLFYSIDAIESQDLFNVIKVHVTAMKIKERDLQNKVRRLSDYEFSS